MVFLCLPITAAAVSEAVLEEWLDDGLAFRQSRCKAYPGRMDSRALGA